MKRCRTKQRIVAALAVPALAVALHAQSVTTQPPSSSTTSTTTPVADEEITKLSPFEVTTSKDTGYAATETLAGTRIRTNLSDVGASISVLTKQFLQDVGATDNSTLLQYTTNAEVAGTRGTYAGVGNGATVSEEDNLRSPQSAQRVRGLAPADNARNFYITDIPWDFYNIERVDILRGPNSILYGLGSPSGIINAATRSAEFRNFGSVEARTGSYGTLRGSFDINQQLAPGVASIRIDGLWNNRKFQQDPAFENDRRLYAAFRFDPQIINRPDFHTSIKGNIEHGEINANRPRILPPTDAFTAWWRPVAVTPDNPFGGMGKVTFANVYDPYRTDNVTATNGRGTSNSTTINYQPWMSDVVNQQQPFFQIDGATNELYNAFAGYINNGARNSSGGFTGVSSGLVGKRQNGMLYNVSGYFPGVVNNYHNANAALFADAGNGQYRQMSLLDPSIFDFYNTLIDGPNKHEWSSWNAHNISLSQTAFDDRLALELTYDRQQYKRGSDSFFGWSPALTIDLTKQFADLSSNPNFGRPFITGGGGNTGSSYVSDRKYMRASLFAELRPSDYFTSPFIRRLFGKQRFNGVGADEKFFNESRTWYLYGNTKAWQGFWNGNDGSTVGVNDRAPVAVVYLGAPVTDRAAASGANVPGVGTTVGLPDTPIRVMDSTWVNYGVGFGDPWNVPTSLYTVYNGLPNPESTTQLTQASNPANYVGWVNNTLDTPLLRYNNGQDNSLIKSAQKALRRTKSYSGSWQGYLWNNAFIPTLGWRYDEVKTRDVTAKANTLDRSIPNLQPNVYTLPDPERLKKGLPPDNVIKGHSTSGGAVLHLNRILERDLLPINVGLSYNESSNFQVTSVRRDVYGNTIGNPMGKTYEYGALLSTKDNKYSLRVTKFTTRVTNGSSTLGSAGSIGGTIANGLAWRNIFLYQLGGYDWASRNQPSYRNTWTNAFPLNNTTPNALGKTGYTQAQADADLDAAIAGWNDIQKFLDTKGFFQAWNFTPTTTSALVTRSEYLANPSAHTPDPASVAGYQNIYAQPQGFSVTADSESKGYEYELIANPLSNWRIAFNASRTVAIQKNVGGQTLSEFVNFVNSKLYKDGNVTPAGALPRFGGYGNAIYPSIWGPWLANYTLLQLQEGSPVPEIRKWRYNMVTSYDFRNGLLKGVGVGGSYRWQDKVIIGYPVKTGGSFATYDLSKPYYGPSEDAIDLWASYQRKITRKINWKIQLNVYNVGKRNGLSPVSIEPDGHTWATVRMSPTQEWMVTNTFSF